MYMYSTNRAVPDEMSMRATGWTDVRETGHRSCTSPASSIPRRSEGVIIESSRDVYIDGAGAEENLMMQGRGLLATTTCMLCCAKDFFRAMSSRYWYYISRKSNRCRDADNAGCSKVEWNSRCKCRLRPWCTWLTARMRPEHKISHGWLWSLVYTDLRVLDCRCDGRSSSTEQSRIIHEYR